MRIGQLIKGARATYQLLEPLKPNTVFKARIVDHLDLNENWAVVKTCSSAPDQFLLAKEYENYQISDIATSPYIRQMYEAIGLRQEHDGEIAMSSASLLHSLCLVLEWMDTDLWHVPSKPYQNGSELPKTVCRSVLSALEISRKHGKVHIDSYYINPNNILLSKIDGAAPEVKVINEGLTKKRFQCLPCRAPEVWKGYGVCHASAVWSVGVTLAHWLLAKPIFSASDKIVEGLTEAWCIAKIERLIGPIGDFAGPDEIGEEFDVAAFLRDLEAEPPIGKVIKVLPLRQELERISGPPASPALLDFILSLLITNVDGRPAAEQALQNTYLNQ